MTTERQDGWLRDPASGTTWTLPQVGVTPPTPEGKLSVATALVAAGDADATAQDAARATRTQVQIIAQDAMALGMTASSAAELSGVSRMTVNSWLVKLIRDEQRGTPESIEARVRAVWRRPKPGEPDN